MNHPTQLNQVKVGIFQKLGQVAASLGSPARLKLIQLLAQSPKTVDELSQASGESVANTSQHLQRLAKEGLVFSVRDGLTKIYQVKSPQVVALWENIQDLAHELAPELNEAENRLTDASLRSPISVDEVLDDVRSGKAMLIDVRDENEARATTVPGAVSIPLKGLSEGARAFSKRKTLYIFCRGRYCSMASDAVRALRKKGFKAYRLRESAFTLASFQKKKSSG